MKSHYSAISLLFSLLLLVHIPALVAAQPTIIGLDTNGAVLQIDHKTGALSEVTEEASSGFSLGGTTRRSGTFYYVSEPSGSDENALYSATLDPAALTHVDLDRSDAVRALFFIGKKLYGVFYDGELGTAGLYRITPETGATSLVLDLSDLDVEPIAGAFTQFGRFFYMLAKPEIDSTQRRLLRFKARAGSAQLFNVVDGTGTAVRCDKIKPNILRNNFVCLASNADETQVNVCRMTLRGVTTCLNTLTDILRVGSGHTMLTPNRLVYYAFVYAPGEPDNQHLIKFSARGVLKSNLTLDTIVTGAHFALEVPQS